MSLQKLTLKVSAIPKTSIFEGKNGAKYLTVLLMENKEPDQYDNDGIARLDVTKEDRAAGVRGEIVGNWKHLVPPQKHVQKTLPIKVPRQQAPPPPAAYEPEPTEADDIPF